MLGHFNAPGCLNVKFFNFFKRSNRPIKDKGNFAKNKQYSEQSVSASGWSKN